MIEAFNILQNKFISNTNVGRTLLESFEVCFTLLKNSFVFVNQIWHMLTFYQYSITQKIHFGILTEFISNCNWEKVFLSSQSGTCFFNFETCTIIQSVRI